MTNRVYQAILICSTLVGSWLGMQLVHEMGHVLGALATGGEVTHLSLHPLAFSRTDVAHNESPGVVVWAGPVVGVLLPVAAWLIAVLAKMPGAFVWRFFAGFCLIVNGLYIGLGSFAGVGDCGEMLRHGAEMWQLWGFGMLTVPLGLWLWHGQGRHFGLGSAPESVRPRVAFGCLIVAVTLIALGLWVGL